MARGLRQLHVSYQSRAAPGGPSSGATSPLGMVRSPVTIRFLWPMSSILGLLGGSKNSIWESNNAWFYADLEPVEKIAKKIMQKVIKKVKEKWSFFTFIIECCKSFRPWNFSCWNFFQFFFFLFIYWQAPCPYILLFLSLYSICM